ncbi:MAG: ribosome small subunit-dependent GTPase A [Flavobacteriales bacterium]|nr:ribosome small subunit-dependent GTPase A [Flavobacteriales bacterium]
MKGTVIKSTGSWLTVKAEGSVIYNCRIKGKFRIQGIKSTNPVAVGDFVEFELEEDDSGTIHTVVDRKNYIIRKSTKLSKQTHIIAANMDQAAIIVSVANPRTPLGFIDRFLATAEAYRIPSIVIFNKVDLCDDKLNEELDYLKAVYESLGYECLMTSATKNIGINESKKLFKDKVTLISGQSGVGKSTLINAIEPSLNLKTSEVSESNEKGKHTTTFAEMFEFSFGGSIIDTPGIRSFGVVDFNKHELSHFFREFFEIGKECKFSDCHHINEPNCAVKKAIENGEIAESRYTSYWNLYIDKDLEKDYK